MPVVTEIVVTIYVELFQLFHDIVSKIPKGDSASGHRIVITMYVELFQLFQDIVSKIQLVYVVITMYVELFSYSKI